MNPKVVVVGSTNVDLTMKVRRLPERGETVSDATFFQTFGGKGANQAVAAARAGGRVRFVAGVGNDPYAATMLENFRRDNIDISQIKLDPDQPSGSALVMIEEGGMNYLSVAPGANYSLEPQDLQAGSSVLEGAGLLLLQMEIPLETNLAAIALANATDIPVILNYAPARRLENELLLGCEFLIVNEGEAQALCGIQPCDRGSWEKAARALADLGPRRAVIITLGAKGCAWIENGAFQTLSAFSVETVDTTAAGDTFCGALGASLIDGSTLSQAIRFASAAAALATTRLGAQPSIPTRAEITTFLSTAQLLT